MVGDLLVTRHSLNVACLRIAPELMLFALSLKEAPEATKMAS